MPLKRYVPTRLLEACTREARACIGRDSLGIRELYGGDNLRIFPYALLGTETIVGYQINVINVPTDFDQGVSGINEVRYEIEFAFHFPINILTEERRENTFLDHIYALREWLFAGGTWPNKASALEDPDCKAQALAILVGFGWEMPRRLPNGAAIVVPAIATWETRELASGTRR